MNTSCDGWACVDCTHVIITRRVNRTSGYLADTDEYRQRMNAAGGVGVLATRWVFGRSDELEDAPRGVRCDVCGGDGYMMNPVRMTTEVER